VKLLIADLDYVIENNETVARVFGRSETGERIIAKISGTRPFFLVKVDAPIPNDNRIVEVRDDGWKDLKGKPLKIIYTRFPTDVAKRSKCKTCSGEGEVVINDVIADCPDCEGTGEVEVGLRGLFDETWQGDIVFSQVLRIYYGLVGEIEIPSTYCHISEIRKLI